MAKKIKVEDFAATQRNRRGYPMSPSYIYRQIKFDRRGEKAKIWFKYELEGKKGRVWIVV